MSSRIMSEINKTDDNCIWIMKLSIIHLLGCYRKVIMTINLSGCLTRHQPVNQRMIMLLGL